MFTNCFPAVLVSVIKYLYVPSGTLYSVNEILPFLSVTNPECLPLNSLTTVNLVLDKFIFSSPKIFLLITNL